MLFYFLIHLRILLLLLQYKSLFLPTFSTWCNVNVKKLWSFQRSINVDFIVSFQSFCGSSDWFIESSFTPLMSSFITFAYLIFHLFISSQTQDLSYKDRHWHEKCFKCSDCQMSLVDTPFANKNERLYCADCHDNNFAARCDGCGGLFRAGTSFITTVIVL